MTAREALHLLVEDLPESELPTAHHVLEALPATTDPILRALVGAPGDDEADDDDLDGGLSEARADASQGNTVSNEEALRQLGLE